MDKNNFFINGSFSHISINSLLHAEIANGNDQDNKYSQFFKPTISNRQIAYQKCVPHF